MQESNNLSMSNKEIELASWDENIETTFKKDSQWVEVLVALAWMASIVAVVYFIGSLIMG